MKTTKLQGSQQPDKTDSPTPLVAVLRHNFKQKFPAWRVQGDAADEIERLTRELAEARAEVERLQSIVDKYGEIP